MEKLNVNTKSENTSPANILLQQIKCPGIHLCPVVWLFLERHCHLLEVVFLAIKSFQLQTKILVSEKDQALDNEKQVSRFI